MNFSKNPERLSKILRVCFGALFVLGCTELAFRTIIFPEYSAMMPDRFIQRPGFVYGNKPNSEIRRYNPMNYDVTVHTNSLGFRGHEENLKEDISGYWIAGGSNTFGAYVEDDEVFVEKLKVYGYPAFNLATDGHDIADQTLVLRDMIERGYKPKGVLISLYALNALQDYTSKMSVLTQPLGEYSLPTEKHTSRDKLSEATVALWQHFPRTLQSIRSRLIKSSAIYGWVKVGIMGIPALRSWTLSVGLRADLDLVHPGKLDILRPLNDDNPERIRITSTANLVSEIRDLVQEKLGVPFGIVLLPTHHQLYPEKFARYVRHHKLVQQDLDPKRPLAAIQAELEKLGIAVLNTLPILNERATSRLTFADDGHLNPEGHAIVAEAIADWLNRGVPAHPSMDTR